MKTAILLIFLFLNFVDGRSCIGRTRNASSGNGETQEEQIRNTSELQKAKVEFLKINCTDDKKCVAIAYCKGDFFTKDSMSRIGKDLSEKFKDKKVVNVDLFDDRILAAKYAKGVGNVAEIQNDRRGWFLRTDEKEFLLFLPNREDKSKPVSINLRVPE